MSSATWCGQNTQICILNRMYVPCFHPFFLMQRLSSPWLSPPLCHAPWSRCTALVILMQLLMRQTGHATVRSSFLLYGHCAIACHRLAAQMKETPLIRCAHNGHLQAVMLLLAKGADVNSLDLVSCAWLQLPSCRQSPRHCTVSDIGWQL